MSKKAICVLFGGNSSEHEVSRVSASNVIQNLDKNVFDVYTVGITKDGRWFLCNCSAKEIADGSWEETNPKSCIISPDTKHHGLLVFNKNGDFAITKIDVIFPVLHGKNGEDGTMQGLFELAQIPYVGNGVLSSAACMDKSITKIILAAAGIPVTDGFNVFDYKDKDFVVIKKKITGSFGYPVVVKPSNAGSSVGVSYVSNEAELEEALKIAAKEDRIVLVERAVDAREIECGALGGYGKAEATIPGEIIKATKMYDYETKYITDTAKTQIPADITAEQAEQIRNYTKQAFKVLGCFGLARIDFFIDKTSGEILLNEINTLPGFTDISLYPKVWENMGIPYSELLTKLIELAEQRFSKQN